MIKAWGTTTHSLPSEGEERFRKQDIALKGGSRQNETLRNTSDIFFSPCKFHLPLDVSLTGGERRSWCRISRWEKPLWWEVPGNRLSSGFKNSHLIQSQNDSVFEGELKVFFWTHHSACQKKKDLGAIINVLNYSSPLMINSLTSLTQPSRIDSHTLTCGCDNWRIFGTGLRMSKLIGLDHLESNILQQKVRTTLNPLTQSHTQTHTHTHHSLAGILTLSGDEVVGSMVALKERRGMTCWVSHLRLRHSCTGGSLTLFLPLPLCILISYWPTLQLWNV